MTTVDYILAATLLLSIVFGMVRGFQLSGAIFENCNLEKCDFRSSSNFIINPEMNTIKGAKFSVGNITGLLQQYNIVIE